MFVIKYVIVLSGKYPANFTRIPDSAGCLHFTGYRIVLSGSGTSLPTFHLFDRVCYCLFIRLVEPKMMHHQPIRMIRLRHLKLKLQMPHQTLHQIKHHLLHLRVQKNQIINLTTLRQGKNLISQQKMIFYNLQRSKKKL